MTINASKLEGILYDLKALCDNNSICEFCPINCLCERNISFSDVKFEDIDELTTIVRENTIDRRS